MRYKPSGNFDLDLKTSDELASGFLLSKLLLALGTSASLNEPLIASVKNSNTPAARIYNWNVLADVPLHPTKGFAKLGVPIPKETQKEVTSGNHSTLVSLLIDLHKKLSAKVPLEPLRSRRSRRRRRRSSTGRGSRACTTTPRASPCSKWC